MRRIAASVLLGVGTALVVLGLSSSLIYDRVALVPLDQKPGISPGGANSSCDKLPNNCYTSRSQGSHMQVLRLWSEKLADGSTKAHYDQLTDATVRSTRTVIGVPGMVPKSEQATTAVWQTGVKSEALGIGDLTYSEETVTFNRKTGEATGSSADKRSAGELDDPSKMVAVEHKGLVFKFPFNVQKKTYAFWDGDLGAASDAKFVREENLYGTNTYVFVQDIPSREITSRDVPPGIFGAGGDAMVAAKVMYGNVRTLWVEPNTGVIIKGQEVLDKSLMSNLGTVYTTKGTIGYDEQTVKDNAKHWGS